MDKSEKSQVMKHLLYCASYFIRRVIILVNVIIVCKSLPKGYVRCKTLIDEVQR